MGFSEYTDFDAIGLADLVRRGEVSATELLDAAIARTDMFNPRLNAIIQRMDDLARLQIKNGLADGPFAGVPFLLKDQGLDIKGAPSSNGSRFRSDAPARTNSTLTERYLAAGLVIFGKTNTPEFAISGSTEPQAFGPSRNPWDISRGTGGSSGGSAAAVAAGFAPMAHASDGGGSIRNPSSTCGVFGLKPTRSRVPMGPKIFEAIGSMAVHHAVTRSVRDSAALLDATAGPVKGDPYPALAAQDESFLNALYSPPPILKIAFHREPHYQSEVHPECIKALEITAKLCGELGHIVEEARPPVESQEMIDITTIFWKVSVAQSVAQTARILGRSPRDTELEPMTHILAEEGAASSAIDYIAAINNMHRFGRRLSGFFDSYDVVLSPVLSRPAWPIGEYEADNTDSRSYFEKVSEYSPFCWPYNMSGQPAMSIPLYWTPGGLPVGLHFAGRYGDERTLLQLAAQLEQAAPWHSKRPPLEALSSVPRYPVTAESIGSGSPG